MKGLSEPGHQRHNRDVRNPGRGRGKENRIRHGQARIESFGHDWSRGRISYEVRRNQGVVSRERESDKRKDVKKGDDK